MKGLRERRAAGEEGQVLPILMTSLVLVVLVGMLLFEVGAAARLKADGRTAADAAALAGEGEVKAQLLRSASGEGASPATIDWVAVEAAAQSYAKRNGGTVTSFQHVLFDVLVTVRGDKALDAADVDRQRAHAVTKARASLAAGYAIGDRSGGPLAGGPLATAGGAVGGGTNRIGASELKAIAKAAHVAIRPDSALRRYAGSGNGDGPDVEDLKPEMKVAIARAEDALGSALQINSAYRTVAYQAQLCARTAGRCAPPGSSLHNFGLAIDVADYPELARVASKAGLCQPFPAPGDDNVHFSPIDGPECGGKSGPLAGGQADGGNPANLVQYAVQLVPYDGTIAAP